VSVCIRIQQNHIAVCHADPDDISISGKLGTGGRNRGGIVDIDEFFGVYAPKVDLTSSCVHRHEGDIVETEIDRAGSIELG
jgi:hypothetical protein